MEQEHFIETVLNTAQSISKVEPDPDLFLRIRGKIASDLVPVRAIWWIAASVAILLAFNVLAISTNRNQPERDNISALAQTLENNNQLY